ncbi:MAB_1171c family putative transporter [Streptomyces sp. WAC06614]|uniref:MAB_1171c family putative transporter n=1 Tax=Streptomyces sp. WAC06614 TaxID=2487416 RepID=UPI0021AF39CB|nr:MAB_1171c family putative transporter [Streptomyces sp. WAC06614]
MSVIYAVLAWVCTFVGIAAFAYRLPEALRRRTDVALWALCTYFLCSGISFLVDLDLLRLHISAFFGLPNITSLITQVAVVVLTAAQQVVLVYWSAPPAEARGMAVRRVAFFTAALTVLVAASFVVGPVSKTETATSTILLSIQDGHYALYMSFYLLICAVGQFETVRLSLRFTRLANRQWLAVGMRTVTLGASMILVYCITRSIQIAGTRLDFDGAALDPIQWTCGSVGALLQVTGWTIPAWGIRITRARGWLHSYRACLRLRPLWRALHRAAPDIALDPPRSWPRELLPTRDPHYRLYRRVIEIRDGQLMLRSSLSLDDFVRVARSLDLPEDPTSPLGEALQVRAALNRRPDEDSGCDEDDGTAAADPSCELPARPPHEDFRQEVEWLTAVAAAFTALERTRRTPHPADADADADAGAVGEAAR